jgi:hypothetical protein
MPFSRHEKIEFLFRFPETDLNANDVGTFEMWDVILLHNGTVFHYKGMILNDGLSLTLDRKTSAFCEAVGDDNQEGLEAFERELMEAAKKQWPDVYFKEFFSFEINEVKRILNQERKQIDTPAK